MTENKNRCVITGLGVICAIGNNVEETWKQVLNSVSGIKETTSVDTKDCYAKLAAEVNDPKLDEIPDAETMDRVSKLCVKAAGEAISDAGLNMTEEDSYKVSVIMGSCVGGVVSVENYYNHGGNASDIPKMPISAIANQVASRYGAGGVITNIANACAAGTISIGYACDLIRSGKSEVVIAGGADAFASVPYAGFISLHALDAQPCSPFNRCSGITLGEGSGVLIVESYEHAMARHAKIYCEVLGSGVSSDAHHITAPREDGKGQMHAIRRGLENSGLTPDQIGYINAHGTGTGKNDAAEFLSLHTIFDDTNDDLSVSSTKAMVGHCLGAAGAIEAVFSVKALTENVVPATVGYTEEDLVTLKEKAGKIDFRANVAKEKELTTVMSNSFAFGGNNASIIFSKEQGEVKLPENPDKVVITGFGVVAPGANTPEDYLAKYCAKTSPEEASIRSAVARPDFDANGLKMAFYRKLDNFSQIQAVSGMSALKNAGLTVTEENATDIGIVVGTSDGPLSTVCNFQMDLTAKGNAAGSAFKFPNTVYNAAGGYLSICSGIMGYNVTVTNGSQSGLSSIAYGYEIIRQGQEKVVLATGTDENSDIMSELYGKLGVVADAPVAPYSGNNGFVLSDGSATIVLESAESAAERGAEALAWVAGYGMAHASVPFGTITGSGAGLDEAIRQALQTSGTKAEEIDAIMGFGNGLAAVDDLEAASYGRIFKEGLKNLPVFSVKSVVGEGRAAAAALSAATAAAILAGKAGSSDTAYVLDENGHAEIRQVDLTGLKNILVTAYGAGGSYTALVLKKA